MTVLSPSAPVNHDAGDEFTPEQFGTDPPRINIDPDRDPILLTAADIGMDSEIISCASSEDLTAPKPPETAREVLRFPKPWVFELRLQPRALSLALAIGQWTLPSAKGGFCFYSAAKLAERLGWSARTVERGLGDLRGAGILERNRRGLRVVMPATVAVSTAKTVGNKRRNSDNGGGATNRTDLVTKPKKERESLSTSKPEQKSTAPEEPPPSLTDLSNRSKKKPSPPSPSPIDATTAQRLVDGYNAMAKKTGWPSCEKPTHEKVSRKLVAAVQSYEGPVADMELSVLGLFAQDDRFALRNGRGIEYALKHDDYRRLGQQASPSRDYFEPEQERIERDEKQKQERIESDERRKRCDAGDHDFYAPNEGPDPEEYEGRVRPFTAESITKCLCGKLSPESQARYDADQAKSKAADAALLEKLFPGRRCGRERERLAPISRDNNRRYRREEKS